MDVATLFSKLRALALALRARDFTGSLRLAFELAMAFREAVDASEVVPQASFATCPCNANDLDACADWCDDLCNQQPQGVVMTAAAFPWQTVLPFLLALLEKLLKN